MKWKISSSNIQKKKKKSLYRAYLAGEDSLSFEKDQIHEKGLARERHTNEKERLHLSLFLFGTLTIKGRKKKCSNANDFSWHPPPPLSFSSLIIHTQLHTIDDCCPTNIIQQSFISPFFPPYFKRFTIFFSSAIGSNGQIFHRQDKRVVIVRWLRKRKKNGRPRSFSTVVMTQLPHENICPSAKKKVHQIIIIFQIQTGSLFPP